MENNSSQEITNLLIDWSKGDEIVLEQLVSLVYEELRLVARRYMSKQPSGHTFQPTDLIHETYVKLASGQEKIGRTAHIFSAWRQRRCAIFWLITRAPNNAKNAAAGRKK